MVQSSHASVASSAESTSAGHRTQAERRANTQAALLEATISLLAEVGYGRTTTNEVARRAGVSRGAQTHHYPTKSDLVIAAVEYVFAERADAFVASFGALSPADQTLESAVDLLWETVRGPAYQALLELVVASRTDPDLEVVLLAVAARFETTVLQLFTDFFPAMAEPEIAQAVVGFAFALLSGAAVTGFAALFGSPDVAVSVLRRLARLGPDVLLALLEGESLP